MKPENQLRLAFVFETHDTTPRLAGTVTQKRKEQMKHVFIPGQINICVLERGTWTGVLTKEPVYPRSAVDFEFKLAAKEAYEADFRRRGKQANPLGRWETYIRNVVGRGENTQHLHRIAALQGVDELNERDYHIGLLYEDGIRMTDRQKDFLAARLALGFPAYKRMEVELEELVARRGINLIRQIARFVNSDSNDPINVFVEGGLLHSRILDHIPQEYRDNTVFAVSDISNPLGNTPMNDLHRIRQSDREPTEKEWFGAYNEYVHYPKVR